MMDRSASASHLVRAEIWRPAAMAPIARGEICKHPQERCSLARGRCCSRCCQNLASIGHPDMMVALSSKLPEDARPYLPEIRKLLCFDHSHCCRKSCLAHFLSDSHWHLQKMVVCRHMEVALASLGHTKNPRRDSVLAPPWRYWTTQRGCLAMPLMQPRTAR